jgi:hypothetical protein
MALAGRFDAGYDVTGRGSPSRLDPLRGESYLCGGRRPAVCFRAMRPQSEVRRYENAQRAPEASTRGG